MSNSTTKMIPTYVKTKRPLTHKGPKGEGGRVLPTVHDDGEFYR
jgi:hypothetical protein